MSPAWSGSARSRSGPRHDRQLVFVSHPVDFSGAPFILMQMIEEFAHEPDPLDISLFAPSVVPEYRERLEAMGVRVARSDRGLSVSSVGEQLRLSSRDLLVLNTVAVSENYQRFMVRAVDAGELTAAAWLIHEDVSSLPDPSLFSNPGMRRRIRRLLEQERLVILVPSQRTKARYDELLGTNKVGTFAPRIALPDVFTVNRAASDFHSIRLLLIGRANDGVKGQITALAALNDFLKESIDRGPGAYRDFTLHLVGLGDDLISREIEIVGKALLGNRLHVYPTLTHDALLALTRDCNVSVSCSFIESFSLSVAQGMAAEHVLLRNDTGGRIEQLEDGVNGYLIDSGDIGQFSGVIERILNPTAVSDADLVAMGRRSRERIDAYTRTSYVRTLALAGIDAGAVDGSVPGGRNARGRRRAGATLHAALSERIRRFTHVSRLQGAGEILGRAQQAGWRRTFGFARGVVRRRTVARLRARAARDVVLVGRPLDWSAPSWILGQVAEEFAALPNARTRVIAPTEASEQIRRLEALDVDLADAPETLGRRFVKLQLGLEEDSIVVLNSGLVPYNYQRGIVELLDDGELEHAFWFLYEAPERLQAVAPAFRDLAFRRVVEHLITAGRLTIVAPSKRAKELHDGFFHTDRIGVLTPRVEVDPRFAHSRPADDYERLHFVMGASAAGAAKGELLAVFAFDEVLKMVRGAPAARYRDFSLSIVGLGDGFVSRQVRLAAGAVLGDRLRLFPAVPRARVLEIASRCNVVIGCSPEGSFGLLVAEAMAMGHVVLRNRSGGYEEQLVDGVNGHAVDEADIGAFAEVIRRVLDRGQTTNAELQAMGAASQEKVARLDGAPYLERLGLVSVTEGGGKRLGCSPQG